MPATAGRPPAATGNLVEQAPLAWQVIGGRRVPVRAGYRVGGDGRISFELGAYDRTLPLTIDPAISYTLFSEHDSGADLATDRDGNLYLTGQTHAGGSINAYIVKLDPDGSVLYNVYYGGDRTDYGNSIAVDSAGNAYIAGASSSANLPTPGGLAHSWGTSGYDAFVARFDATGQLVTGSYLGGSDWEVGLGIALDGAANAYVTGWTWSTDFVTSAGAFQPARSNPSALRSDAFVTKLNLSDGVSLVYSSYLGGQIDDVGNGIAVDGAGYAYVTGSTNPPAVFRAARWARAGPTARQLSCRRSVRAALGWNTATGSVVAEARPAPT